jgi:hypothetical protein
LLTGKPTFQRTPAEILDQIRFSPPRRPTAFKPDVPPYLERICLKCLAKEPSQRYVTAADFGDELQRFLTAGPIQSQALPVLTEEYEKLEDQRADEAVPSMSRLPSSFAYCTRCGHRVEPYGANNGPVLDGEVYYKPTWPGTDSWDKWSHYWCPTCGVYWVAASYGYTLHQAPCGHVVPEHIRFCWVCGTFFLLSSTALL